jgi:hypothetical protein
MSRVAVVCAYNPRNSGMYSVDLAARHFFASLGAEHELCVTQNRTKVASLRYRLVRSVDDLRGFDAVVYWGDFLNNPMWGAGDYAEREVKRHRASGPIEGFERWRQLYLHTGAGLPVSTRIYSFGGCFMGMEPTLEDASVRASMGEFLQRASAVVVRDPLSFEALSRLDGGSSKVSLGFDCASLLMPARGPAAWRGRYFAHSFSRSLGVEAARALVEAVERETGLRGIAVDWLFARWPKRVVHAKFALNLALMRHARFCLTDTYHFAVNSMSQGSLPLCVVRDEPAVSSTLNELKKVALFRMVGLDAALLRVPGEPMQLGSAPDMRAVAQVAAQAVSRLGANHDWRSGFSRCQADLQGQLRRHFA